LFWDGARYHKGFRKHNNSVVLGNQRQGINDLQAGGSGPFIAAGSFITDKVPKLPYRTPLRTPSTTDASVLGTRQ